MNYVSREELIEFARKAFAKGLSATSMTTLEGMAVDYGNQQNRLDDVRLWFRNLENNNFDGTRADTEWLDNWLSELP